MSKKFGFESSLYPSKNDEISLELGKLKFFRIEYPRGGQYNDGYTLAAEFTHSYDDDLVLLLMELGIKPNLLEVKPPPYKEYPDPIYDEVKIGGESKWLQKVGYCKIDNEWFYVSYGKEGLRIVANGGSYEVEWSDVIRAKSIEKKMNYEFFYSRVGNA